MASSEAMRRSADHRRDLPRVDRGLTIVVRHDSHEQVCILENVSNFGAGLRVSPHFQLPKRFTLILANMQVPVQLKWRNHERAGVKFTVAAGDRPLAQRVLTGFLPRKVADVGSQGIEPASP